MAETQRLSTKIPEIDVRTSEEIIVAPDGSMVPLGEIYSHFVKEQENHRVHVTEKRILVAMVLVGIAQRFPMTLSKFKPLCDEMNKKILKNNVKRTAPYPLSIQSLTRKGFVGMKNPMGSYAIYYVTTKGLEYIHDFLGANAFTENSISQKTQSSESELVHMTDLDASASETTQENE